MAKFDGETPEPINKCPRCGTGSWNWRKYDEDFDPGVGGYKEYVCNHCELHIYENYTWSHTDWMD